jgi:hypothetical protein
VGRVGGGRGGGDEEREREKRGKEGEMMKRNDSDDECVSFSLTSDTHRREKK